MAVRSVKNQYLGINAHLHSRWQAQGGWPEFHSGYVWNLFNALKLLLLPIGYTAAVESSLQIRRLDLPGTVDRPQSDVTIYDPDPIRPFYRRSEAFSSAADEMVMPITDALLEPPISEKTYNAIKIYEVRAEAGDPVVWIELLSPSNKPGGSDAAEYLRKRDKLVESGIALVEIDYLHESPPTVRSLPVYRPDQNTPHARPYHILIFDPRPNLNEGILRIAGFDVDAPIPTLTIPLNDDDLLTFDFGPPYHRTLAEALYGLEVVDYGQLPVHFERYHARDQARIANRILAVLRASQAGTDLETGPFPAPSLPLEDALKAIDSEAASR